MSEQTSKKYYYGTGRRKSAIARVRVFPNGSNKVIVNQKIISDEKQIFFDPLKLVGKYGSTDISVKVSGGGHKGQQEAIRHGIARALVELDEMYRTTLKKAGFLIRDPRVKERKKPGLKGARRSPQWSKR